MKRGLFLGVLLALAQSSVLAQHKAHQHGAGALGVVQEGAVLTLLLEIPQHDLVGFERAPKTPREQLAAQAALEKLRQPAKLFTPTPAARCSLSEQSVDAPLLTGGVSKDGHGDVEARYVYQCADAQALKDLQVDVLGELPRLHALAVSFAGPKGQKAGRLTGKRASFTW